MRIFKKKKEKEKPEFIDFPSIDRTTIPLLDLSDYHDPQYPTIATYYGQPIASLASGTYDEVLLSSWIYPSGTVWEYPKYSGNIEMKTLGGIFERIVCRYCGQSFMLNKEQIKSPIFILSCPSCGARI